MVAARTRRSRQHLISLAEAADHLDVSTRTLRRYIAAGRLTGYRVGPRLIKMAPGRSQRGGNLDIIDDHFPGRIREPMTIHQ
jgi:excisionase family DNA binding protein